MAPRTRAKAKEAELPEPTEELKDYSKYIDKDPTDLQQRFTDWLIENVYGGDLGDIDADDFAEGVRLGTALRMEFQRSPENQKILEETRRQRESADDEPDEKPAPRRGRKAAAKTEPEEEPAKPTRARRGRAVAKATEDADDDAGADEPATSAAKPARGRRGAATGRAAKAATPAKASTARRGRRTADAAPF